MKSKLWHCLFLGILAVSCSKPIELPEVIHEPKLAIFAEIYQGGISAIITNSVSRDGDPPNHIIDAEVLLKKENGETHLLTFDAIEGQYLFNNFTPVAGETYQLEVTHPDFPKVTSSTTMPAPISIDSMDISFVGKRLFNIGSEDTIWSYKIKIYLNEIGAEVPFLSLTPATTTKIVSADSTRFFKRLSANFSAEGLEYFYENDYLLNIQEINADRAFSFIGNFYLFGENELHEVGFEIKSVSNEKREFVNFLVNQNQFEDDIFILDPIEIQGNIENGYGLFEAYTSDSVEKLVE